MQLTEILTGIFADAFEHSGYDRDYGSVTVSKRPDLCHFQCNGALSAGKNYKRAPMDIADSIVSLLKEDTRLSQLEAVRPGFINIKINDCYLADIMNQMLGDDRLLLPTPEAKTIVIDYGGPNLAKPLHVGHLRSAIIGNALYRLAKFLGHNIISDVHFGDWGLQIGLVIMQAKSLNPDLIYFNPEYQGDYPTEPPLTPDDLNVIYPQASLRARSDSDFAAAAAQATLELQAKKGGYYAFWEQIRKISIEDIKRNYQKLDISFDYWYGESDAEPYIPRVVDILKERGLLQKSEGASIVDVSLPDDKEPMPPIIIEKSNGGDVYGTTDLGSLLQRVEDFTPDELWYVVDNRQALHFKQVFRCAALAGIIPSPDVCQHISFGTMNGKDGKPYKTREGGVMRLSDMIETVTNNALERTVEADIVTDKLLQRETAQKIGVAALKIGDMMNHRAKDFIFDLDRFMASDGKTGPYLLYTAVRINSVLKKASEAGCLPGKIIEPAGETERDLMLSLTSISNCLLRAYTEKAPNIICDTLFDIAGIFNRFYGTVKIITCQDERQRASWLGLLNLTARAIAILLDILGISIPEQM